MQSVSRANRKARRRPGGGGGFEEVRVVEVRVFARRGRLSDHAALFFSYATIPKKLLHQSEHFKGKHRFEHWYRDNTIYFITSKCREYFHAFAADQAKSIFWDRFNHYTAKYGFSPWLTTLLDNHYHTIGHLAIGENLGPMMQKIHGSVAKLVNDTLPERHLPFWRTAGNQDYFDGCIRDESQASRAYRYTLNQAKRAGIVRDWRDYPHTHMMLPLDEALAQASRLKAYLPMVPYARYQREGR